MKPPRITGRVRAALVALLLAAMPLWPAPPEKPNIIFILVDDLGPEWISVYGAEDIRTPNIDKLSDAGMLFETAWSMPQCTPTRVTLLTGQYPYRHGWVNHWDVPRWGAGAHFDPEEYFTFSRLLKDAGYATAVAGKWQINDFRVQPEILRSLGFDEWCMWTGGEGGNPKSDERYWDPYIYTDKAKSQIYKGKFGPDMFNDFVLDFLKRHRDEPMFVYYSMALTHTPFVHTPLDPDASTKLEQHKAMVRYTDHLTGKVIQQLDSLSLRENTYIFFTTDNGSTRGITGHIGGRAVPGGKGTDTIRGVHAPFIVNAPGRVPGGVTSQALTDHSDMLPTFAELAGVALPSGVTIDGKSIAGVLHGEDERGPREWILAMGHDPARLDEEGIRGVYDFAPRQIRDGRYKITVAPGGKIVALHDMEKDPWEDNNLIDSGQPEHRTALRRLAKVLASQPKADARPQYTPLPPQPWDISREENERMWKRGMQKNP